MTMIPKSSTAFADGAGREWSCKVTVSTLERCREAGGFDPIRFIHSGELWKGVLDPILIADLAWFAVEQDAINRGVSKQAFKDSLHGDAITAARDAWFNAFAAFLPSRQGESLLKDKEGVERRIDNHLTDSPSNGGPTSTDAQA